MAAALDRFLAGTCDAHALWEWAELIDAREDIGFEAGSESALRRMIFDISMADVSDGEPGLTRASVQAFRDKLGPLGAGDRGNR